MQCIPAKKVKAWGQDAIQLYGRVFYHATIFPFAHDKVWTSAAFFFLDFGHFSGYVIARLAF